MALLNQSSQQELLLLVADLLELAFCSAAPSQQARPQQETAKDSPKPQRPAAPDLASKHCGDQPKDVAASRSASTARNLG